MWGRRKAQVEIERLEAELAEASRRGESALVERDRLRVERDQLRGRLKDAENRAGDLADRLDRTEADLAAARHEVDEIQGRLRRQTEESAATAARTRDVSQQLTQLRAELADARAESSGAASALADARATLASTRAELVTTQDKLVTTQDKLVTTQDKLAAVEEELGTAREGGATGEAPDRASDGSPDGAAVGPLRSRGQRQQPRRRRGRAGGG